MYIRYNKHRPRYLIHSTEIHSTLLLIGLIDLIDWMILEMLQCLIIVRAVQYKPLTFGSYEFTGVGSLLTWLEIAFIVCWIPLYAIFLICKEAKVSMHDARSPDDKNKQ